MHTRRCRLHALKTSVSLKNLCLIQISGSAKITYDNDDDFISSSNRMNIT